MNNIRFSKHHKDERPVLICEKDDYLRMNNVRAFDESEKQAVLMRDVKILKKNITETVEKRGTIL